MRMMAWMSCRRLAPPVSATFQASHWILFLPAPPAMLLTKRLHPLPHQLFRPARTRELEHFELLPALLVVTREEFRDLFHHLPVQIIDRLHLTKPPAFQRY